MSEMNRVNRETAENLLREFLPMFAEFERQGVDYCLVGGLAVVAHCLARDADRFRATHDADTIAIYGADIQTSPRPQDFVDVGILSSLVDGQPYDPDEDSHESSPLSRLRELLGGSDGKR